MAPDLRRKVDAARAARLARESQTDRQATAQVSIMIRIYSDMHPTPPLFFICSSLFSPLPSHFMWCSLTLTHLLLSPSPSLFPFRILRRATCSACPMTSSYAPHQIPMSSPIHRHEISPGIGSIRLGIVPRTSQAASSTADPDNVKPIWAETPSQK